MNSFLARGVKREGQNAENCACGGSPAVIIPVATVFAETSEEIMNNLIGPSEQYNTMLSPVYLKQTIPRST